MANYSLTPRVKMLAERLLAQNSTISAERATILASIGDDIAGMPPMVKNAQRFCQLMTDSACSYRPGRADCRQSVLAGSRCYLPHGSRAK